METDESRDLNLDQLMGLRFGYGPGWRLFQLTLVERPRGLREWSRVVWGFDLWLGPLPVLKFVAVLWVLAIAF